MRRADNDDSRALLDDTRFCQLHRHGQGDTGLRIVEEAKPIDLGRRVGKFRFRRLVNDAIGRTEAFNGLGKADRVADLNCRR